MRMIWLMMAMLLGVATAHAIERYEDPKSLVSAIYDNYRVGQVLGDPTIYYSTRLKATFDQAVENNVFSNDAAMSGASFKLDAVFNPFLPDANALLSNLTIGEPSQIDDRAVVNVSYNNFDHPRLLSIALVREDGGWKVDDVTSMGPEDHWLLSWALTYDPLGF